jgi:hypothetical protein
MSDFEKAILREIAKALRLGQYVCPVLPFYGPGDMRKGWRVPMKGFL